MVTLPAALLTWLRIVLCWLLAVSNVLLALRTPTVPE